MHDKYNIVYRGSVFCARAYRSVQSKTDIIIALERLRPRCTPSSYVVSCANFYHRPFGIGGGGGEDFAAERGSAAAADAAAAAAARTE